MTKITTTTKPLTSLPKKYTRITITTDKQDWHRLVETADGALEYRIGAGTWKKMAPRTFQTFVRSIVRGAKQHKLTHIALAIDESHIPYPTIMKPERAVQKIAENLTLAAYEFTKYKTDTKNETPLTELRVVLPNKKSLRDAWKHGEIVAQSTNIARDIANTTAADMTPAALGTAARRALKGTHTTVKVLGEKELKRLKMGALLAVGQGTESETKLICIEYWGAGKSKEKPIVLIGKGITYDTGGLNVKPSGGMHDMHLDMSGGSSVIGALTAAAKLKLKKNVIGIIPAAENAVSDRAMRAGDIVTSMSGKTIEVVHTDAEGRMVLADGLTYATKYDPRVILDAATLTGAALVALGQHASAILTKHQKLEQKLREIGEASGEYVWPLPLWDEYAQYIKSARADVANIAPNFSRYGGTIEGGTFLAHFAPKNVPWAHLDMASRMESIAADKLADGSTGEPTRLFVEFIERY